MTLSIPISPEVETKLRERAAAAGQDITSFAREAVEEKLRLSPSFAELLAPIHAATQKSGMTSDALDDVIEQCRDDVYAEKHGKRPA